MEHSQHQMFDAIESMEILQLLWYRSYLLLTIGKWIFFHQSMYDCILNDFEHDLLEQNRMETECQLYHLYVHSIFVSNIRSFLKMYKYSCRDYNRHLLRLQEQN